MYANIRYMVVLRQNAMVEIFLFAIPSMLQPIIDRRYWMRGDLKPDLCGSCYHVAYGRLSSEKPVIMFTGDDMSGNISHFLLYICIFCDLSAQKICNVSLWERGGAHLISEIRIKIIISTNKYW